MYLSSKTGVAVAIAAALMLSGCEGEDGLQGLVGPQGEQGAQGPQGEQGTSGVVDPSLVTTSGFAFPLDAIFISPDALDGSDITDAIMEALFEVPEGSTVVLPQGNFAVSSTITIPAAKKVTLTGYGIYETKLDFSTSTGDDAIKYEGGQDITIRDFSVYEAPKNGIKVVGANGVHIAYTATVWEGELEADNGAYGLYPLQSQNVLMEHNFAYGSADAGIYVGQSNNIVVRNNTAKKNVAGIEIENSNNADVYNNLALDNTGGILTFDLPGLQQAYGGNIRIFNNDVRSNNAENVGGGTVGIVPPGTGVLIFSVSDVEIYNNRFSDNETASIEIASYFLADSDVANYPIKWGATMANGWSPLVKNVYMHDNEIMRSGANPRGDLITDIIAGYTMLLGQTMPAIFYGGIGESLSNANALLGFNQLVGEEAALKGIDYDPYEAKDRICAANNINANSVASSSEFKDVNIGIVFSTSIDMAAPDLVSEPLHGNETLMACTQERLMPATVTFKGKKYGCLGDDLAAAACAL